MRKIAAEFSEFVLFSEEEIRALDDRVVMRENRGKEVPYVTCLVRDKDVQLKPEERTRQLWLARPQQPLQQMLMAAQLPNGSLQTLQVCQLRFRAADFG